MRNKKNFNGSKLIGELLFFSNTNLAVYSYDAKRINLHVNLEFNRILKKKKTAFKKTNLCAQACATLLNSFICSSASPRPLFKSCKNDFWLLVQFSGQSPVCHKSNQIRKRRKVFWDFQGVKEGCIGNKWVK